MKKYSLKELSYLILTSAIASTPFIIALLNCNINK